MITTFFWELCNTLLSLLVAGIGLFCLYRFPHNFTDTERYGLGISAAGAVMTIAPIVNGATVTPYTDWAPALFRIGIAVFLTGRTIRFLRHERNGTAQNDVATKHLRARGKL